MEYVRAAEAVRLGAVRDYEFLCDIACPSYMMQTWMLFAGPVHDDWTNQTFAADPVANVAVVGDSRSVGVVGGWWNYDKALASYLGNEISVYNFPDHGIRERRDDTRCDPDIQIRHSQYWPSWPVALTTSALMAHPRRPSRGM
jgi:hypothetical protein